MKKLLVIPFVMFAFPLQAMLCRDDLVAERPSTATARVATADGFNPALPSSTDFWSYSIPEAMDLQKRSYESKARAAGWFDSHAQMPTDRMQESDLERMVAAAELRHIRAIRGLPSDPRVGDGLANNSRVTAYSMTRTSGIKSDAAAVPLRGKFEADFFPQAGQTAIVKSIEIAPTPESGRAEFRLRVQSEREAVGIFAQMLEAAYGELLEGSAPWPANRHPVINTQKWLQSQILVSTSHPMYLAATRDLQDDHPQGPLELSIELTHFESHDEITSGLIWGHSLRRAP